MLKKMNAWQVYGSRDDLAISLRNLTNDFGRLREGPVNDYGKPLLPFNDRHDIDCRSVTYMLKFTYSVAKN
jgi:hypothetical protein